MARVARRSTEGVAQGIIVAIPLSLLLWLVIGWALLR
jgi:hypothetical protein